MDRSHARTSEATAVGRDPVEVDPVGPEAASDHDADARGLGLEIDEARVPPVVQAANQRETGRDPGFARLDHARGDDPLYVESWKW